MDKKRLQKLAGVQLNEQVRHVGMDPIDVQQIIQEAINDVLRSTVEGELSVEDRDRIVREAMDKYETGM